jgi:hypothetical protein
MRCPAISVLTLLFTLAVEPARAHWLVFELKFETDETEESVNFHFHSGAYVVAPADGGAASLIFTLEEGKTRMFAVSERAARFFTTVSGARRRMVISALALNGSSHAFYLASGLVNQDVALPGEDGPVTRRAAATLAGRLQAADDDSEAVLLPADGSLGMSGSAIISGRLRADLSANASRFATHQDAVRYLVALLEHYGYEREGAEQQPLAVALESGVMVDAAAMRPAEKGSGDDAPAETVAGPSSALFPAPEPGEAGLTPNPPLPDSNP